MCEEKIWENGVQVGHLVESVYSGKCKLVIDELLEEAGFELKDASDHEERYERKMPEYNYTHEIDFNRSVDNGVQVVSYDKDHRVMSTYNGIAVALTLKELELIYLKAKQLNEKWNGN